MTKQSADEIIETLEQQNFYAECPCCQGPMRLRDAGLFYLDRFTPRAEERYRTMMEKMKERRRALQKKRTGIVEKSQKGAEAVNIGFILERVAPALKAFRFERNDCRSLFDPIDYIIFEGLSRSGRVSRIVFTDIKTGDARLSKKQRAIKTLVGDKKVEFDTYENKEV